MAEGEGAAEAGAGGGAGSSILRELLVLVGLDVAWKDFSKAMLLTDLLSGGLEKLAEKVAQGVERFGEMIKETAEATEKIEILAQQTGLEADELQSLMSAAQATGVSVEMMTHGITMLSREMFMAKEGSSIAKKAFADLGVKFQDSNGKLRDGSAVLKDIADKFSTMKDSATKSALAGQLFGRLTGTQLIPLLNRGKEGIEKLADQYPNLTDAQVEAGSALLKEQKKIQFDTQWFWQHIVAAQIPALLKITRGYRETRRAMLELIQPAIIWFTKKVWKAFMAIYDVLHSVSLFVISTTKLIIRNWKFLAVILGALTIGIVAGNAALIASFIATKAAAIAAAAQVVIAWAVAAAPFVAIAGAIYTLFLYFDDLRVYLNGGRSLIGKFLADLREWWKPQPGDTFFVSALKKFVKWTQDAIASIKKLAAQLGIATGTMTNQDVDKLYGANASDLQDQTDKTTLDTARKRLTLNKKAKLTDREKQAISRQNMDEKSFVADVREHPWVSAEHPTATSTTNSSNTSSTVVHQTNHIKIDAKNMSADELGKAVEETLGKHIDDAANHSGD